MALHTNEMDRLGLYYDLQSRLESYLEQRGKLPILLAEIFTLKRQVPPTKLVVLSRPDLQGSSPLTQETHQLNVGGSFTPRPCRKVLESTTNYVGGTCRHSDESKEQAVERF
jgi:hypothetical protein